MSDLISRSEVISVLEQLEQHSLSGKMDISNAIYLLENQPTAYDIDKLAEYEDFEEIFREKMTDTACEFLKDKEEFRKWLDRNKWITKKCDEWARAEEQGLLLRLPVKAGDTVYALRYGEENDFIIVETKIIEIRQNMNGIFFEPLISRKAYKTEDFGKDVFLTQAEAEQKLKEIKESD